MPENRFKAYAVPAALAVVLLLLVVVLFQVHQLERRFIAQGQQLQKLGEATERLAAGGLRTSGPAQSSDAAVDPTVKLLHPEVPNYLKPAETRWPPAGATLDGVFTRGWDSGDPKGFNSLLENAADLGEYVEVYAAASLASTNVWTNPDNYSGELAWRVEITNDYKEYTFYLKKGVKWHPVPGVDLNGKFAWLKGDHEVTAQDFVFTLDMILNPQVESGPTKNYYSDLEKYEAVDPYTLVLRWKKKIYTSKAFSLGLGALPEFLYAYDQDGKRFPKETQGLRFNQHWYNNKGYVGAGPYRMVSYQPGVKIEFTRNEQYVGDKPGIASLVYPIYTDRSQTLLKLKAKEVSFAELQPGQYREEVLQYEGKAKPKNNPFFDGRIQCKKVTSPSFRYVAWNADRPMFSDARVRRAMTHAFDRQRIIDSVYVGLGTITTHPYLPGNPGVDPTIKPIPFDLAEAKRLLAEAGWTDTDGDGLLDKQLRPGDAKRTPFEFKVTLFSGSKEGLALANIYREDLLKVGVRMNIDALEWSLMLKRMDEKAFDAIYAAWALGWDIDLYQIWHSSQADLPKGSNRVGFRNKEADKLIEQLRDTFEPEKRTEILRAFHRLVDAEQPYSFFMVRQEVHCWWNDVRDVMFSKVRPVVNVLPWWVARAGG
jgi:ABC-type transport system substrate-binding protein